MGIGAWDKSNDTEGTGNSLKGANQGSSLRALGTLHRPFFWRIESSDFGVGALQEARSEAPSHHTLCTTQNTVWRLSPCRLGLLWPLDLARRGLRRG